MFKAVITGVAGQDGSYLAENLLLKGYQVIGITRRKSVTPCLDNLINVMDNPNFKLIYGDVNDSTLIYRILVTHQPYEWYNLAASSNVGQSFKEPTATFKINAEAVITQLDAIKEISPSTRYYQASTSELWGGEKCPITGFDENSIFHPRSPYGVSKLAAYWSVRNYRESYGLFACNGLLSNHSSSRRGHDFATRKITKGVAAVKLGIQNKVKLGNLDAFRDEGHSKDYVEAMYLMLQKEAPQDYVIATGTGATIKEMLAYVCELADLNIDNVYEQDPQFLRPSDVPYLKGNPEKAKQELGWVPTYSWKNLLKEMYLNDLELLKNKKGE